MGRPGSVGRGVEVPGDMRTESKRGEGSRPPCDGWRDDPFGRFESRHFFIGEPTSLVRQGSREGLDPVGPLLAGEGEEPLFAHLAPRLSLELDRVLALAAEHGRRAPPPPVLPAAPNGARSPAVALGERAPAWPLDVEVGQARTLGTTTFLPPSQWRPCAQRQAPTASDHRWTTDMGRYASRIAGGAAVVAITASVVHVLRAPLATD